MLGKFLPRKASIEVLPKEFHTMGFKCSFLVGWLDPCHVLVCFDPEGNYMRFWMKEIWTFQDYPLRVFKWTPKFQLMAESSILLVWVNFEGLLIHFFNKAPLFSIATTVGNPLKVPTTNFTRSNIVEFALRLTYLSLFPNGYGLRLVLPLVACLV